MTDDIFNDYKTRGATSRDEFIISKQERDNDTLTCTPSPGTVTLWEVIYEKGNIPNLVYMGEKPSDFEIVSDFFLLL